MGWCEGRLGGVGFHEGGRSFVRTGDFAKVC